MLTAVSDWMTLPAWTIRAVGSDANCFVTRIGSVAQVPRSEVLFVDQNIEFVKHLAGIRAVLGYSVRVLSDNHQILVRPWYMSVIDPKIEKHNSPAIVYSDQNTYLRQFGTDRKSYWLALRKRST